MRASPSSAAWAMGVEPKSFLTFRVAFFAISAARSLVVDVVDCPLDWAGAVGLGFVDVRDGGGANALEGGLAVAGFDEAGEGAFGALGENEDGNEQQKNCETRDVSLESSTTVWNHPSRDRFAITLPS